ncbi:hypothetical protein CGCS363_v011335 [Colletotrichum siamense]|uniref:uncharacterized protein n=1 Tax=Colletotrichum siamense TaxID=690259 RepID=UPI0018731D17|nr:uncharacterized protein CGCS363_v011335 [Colletotrichum siamense]KAF5492715.1 hypothetical protein CGCS363_v011335 [Colletotrichum siamense]
MTGIKKFYLCCASRDDRLFIVEIHTGFSRKPPLGSRPGILLRNGTDSKDPIIAAAGDESQFAARAYAFNSTTNIFLPPLEPRASVLDMDTESMRASVSAEKVAFLFSIEVGEKQQRERFEWTKLKKGEDHEAKSGGFRLAQVSKRHGKPQMSSEAASESVEEGPSSSPEEPVNHGSLTLPSWSSGLSKMTHRLLPRLQTSASSMGNCWAFMVVITALRLWEMNVQGRKSKVGVLVEGKIEEVEKTRLAS